MTETPADREPGASRVAAEDDVGEDTAAEPAKDGGPELDTPERAGSDAAAPISDPDVTVDAGEGAAEPMTRSGRLPRRSARERRWGKVIS